MGKPPEWIQNLLDLAQQSDMPMSVKRYEVDYWFSDGKDTHKSGVWAIIGEEEFNLQNDDYHDLKKFLEVASARPVSKSKGQ